MKTILSALTVVGGLLAFAPAATAGSPGVLRVEDKAGAFSPEGVKQAEKLFADTQFKSTTHFTVVTVTAKEVPASLKADLQAAMDKKDRPAANRVFTDWAHDLAKSERERGVFVLAYLQGEQHWVHVSVDKQTDVSRHFTDADAKKVSDLLVDGFKKAKGKPAEEAKATRDVALLAATNDVIAELKNTSAPEPTGHTRTNTNTDKSSGGGMGGLSIGGWICLLLVVGLGIWLVIGLIRAFSGMGGGGYGYGGGYGGGGGFMSSFLGGMFGAAAGMWLYDSFTGGHHYNDVSASDAGGGGDYGDTGGAGDFDNGADAGGGDFGGGDDAGGGDFGDAGGGDFGGGGGDFGGGDFGGGGGDFGGGDW